MLYRHLAAQAAARPDAPALVDADGTLDFGTLDRRTGAVAARLAAAGMGVGSRVLVAAGGRSSALFVLVGGLLRAGAAAVVPDATRGLRGALDAWRRVPVDAVVVPSAWARVLPARLFGRHVFGLGALVADGPPGAAAATPAVPPGTAALVTFTSGTTGPPRPVVRTHAVLDAQFAAVQALLHAAPGDRDLATLPVFALASLGAGATVVLPDQPLRRIAHVDAPALVAQIVRDGITRLVASPALLERVLEAAPPGALARLRHVHTGGGPVFPDLLAALAHAAPAAAVVAVYGSTEAEPIAAWEAADGWPEGEGLCAGRVVPGAQVVLVRPEAVPGPARRTAEAWAQACAAPGAVGEIAVAGPHVVPATEGADDPSKRIVATPEGDTGWHLTGDLGRFDAQGRLWLLGRAAAWTPGAPYPLAVEAALRQVPGVGRATLAVLGGGQTVVAYDGTAAEAAVRAALPPGRVDAVVRLRRLPRDLRHDAKIDLPALRRRLRRA